MKISAIQCPKCLNVVFSRARHDMRGCSCRQVAIDGGRDYNKVSYQDSAPHVFDIHLVGGLDQPALFHDWNNGKDKFGLIKTKKVIYGMLYRYTLNRSGKFYRYEIKK